MLAYVKLCIECKLCVLFELYVKLYKMYTYIKFQLMVFFIFFFLLKFLL